MRKYIALLMVMTIVGGGLTIYLLSQTGLAVIINNETDEEITGLSLTYEHIKTDIEVPPIAPGENDVIEVDPKVQSTDDFNEGALVMQYQDNNEKVHSETVIGYFERGYSGDAEITIKSIDVDGILTLDIEDNTDIY